MSVSSSHALILEGGDPLLLKREGLARAAAWLCARSRSPSGVLSGDACGVCPVCKRVLAGEHADLHLIDEGAETSIKVEQIRALRRDLHLRPLEGAWSCALILRAETLTRPSQNALLELLEEPPRGVRLLLCTSAADALLPTIRSRCTCERFRGEGDKTSESVSPADRESAAAWLAAIDDDWERAAKSFAWEKLDRDALRRRLTALLVCLRETMDAGAAERHWETADLIRAAWDALNRNASVGIVCGLLAAGDAKR